MSRRRQAAAAATILAMTAGVSGVSAARRLSPAQYRSKIESVCRINGVMKAAVQRRIDAAYSAKNWSGYFDALGNVVGLVLIQDRQLETTPFPASLRSQMAPAMIELRGLDAHLHNAVEIARTGDTKAMLVEIAKASPFGARAARHLEAAGLRHCAAIYS
jgi:hypothetical protein